MKEEQNHFIKNIEIKNFKCFENFSAEGFGRVNLIGGKNNVGKTAFMEACYLANTETRQKRLKQIIKNRYLIDIFTDLYAEIGTQYIDNFLEREKKKYTIDINIDIKTNEMLFKSSNKVSDKVFDLLYGTIIDNELEQKLDTILYNFDKNISKFRIKESKAHCQSNGTFYHINELGEGLNQYIAFIILLLTHKNAILFIDEIENGIHYTNLDKLWEIILTISKEQNVQVFATTHSKECIESYARVAKKLEDEEIAFIELGRNKKNELDSVVMNSEMFQRFVKLGNEVRGW
jgi:AAA15 family ATPase/GTPase